MQRRDNKTNSAIISIGSPTNLTISKAFRIHAQPGTTSEQWVSTRDQEPSQSQIAAPEPRDNES